MTVLIFKSGYSRMIMDRGPNGVGRKRSSENEEVKYDVRGSGGGGGGGGGGPNPNHQMTSNDQNNNNNNNKSGLNHHYLSPNGSSGGYGSTSSSDYLNELLNMYKSQPGVDLDLKGMTKKIKFVN